MTLEQLLEAAQAALPGKPVVVSHTIGEPFGWTWAIFVERDCLCGSQESPEHLLSQLDLAKLEAKAKAKAELEELRAKVAKLGQEVA